MANIRQNNTFLTTYNPRRIGCPHHQSLWVSPSPFFSLLFSFLSFIGFSNFCLPYSPPNPSNILFPFLVSSPSLNSNLNLSMGIYRTAYFFYKMERYTVTSFHSSPFDGHDVHHGALDCRASSLSYLSLNCSYSDFFIPAFSGRSESHLLFPSRS